MKAIKTWPLLLAITVSLSGCFESDEEKLNQALSLYTKSTNDQEAISKARPLFTQLAEKGDGKAEYMLATMYIRGDGVVIDNNKALKLLLSASAHGNGDASLLASQFYSQSRYGQSPDPDKAQSLLRKSARDGSAIGQLTLGDAYLTGTHGFSMSLKDAHEQLVKIGEGPYRLPAARSLYDIYSTPNQPLFSPEKATAEMERIWAVSKDLAFAGPLGMIYSGNQFGDKGDSVKSAEKLNLLIADLEKEHRLQAVTMIKIGAGLVPADQMVPMLLKAVKSDPQEEAFGLLFCNVMRPLYLSAASDASMDPDDLIKACMPGAESNNSVAQLTVAGAYAKKKAFTDAYEWAYMSYLNGNSQGLKYASEIAATHFVLDVEGQIKAATKARAGYASAPVAKSPNGVLDYFLPWYTVSDVVANK